MTARNKISRAITRAQKTQERIAALEAALLEEELETDRVLGEAVRKAVTNSRSKWAAHTDLTLQEFYDLAVGDGAAGDEPSGNETAVNGGHDGEELHHAHDTNGSEFGAGASGEAGASQGF